MLARIVRLWRRVQMWRRRRRNECMLCGCRLTVRHAGCYHCEDPRYCHRCGKQMNFMSMFGLERNEAQQYLADAAAADTHSSDVDPGCLPPW